MHTRTEVKVNVLELLELRPLLGFSRPTYASTPLTAPKKSYAADAPHSSFRSGEESRAVVFGAFYSDPLVLIYCSHVAENRMRRSCPMLGSKRKVLKIGNVVIRSGAVIVSASQDFCNFL